jgi:DNA-binding CsgD family transcriptional regulator
MAVDAARVLRVVGTYHGGTGSVVEAITPTGDVWTFNHLADRLLPLTRVELHDLRVQRALRHARSTSERHHTPPEGFTQATLWEARLSDLQRLREVRGSGQPLPDFRDRWLFVAGVAMSWLALPIVLQRELHALAHEVGGWTEAKTRSKLHAIFRTAHEAAAGRKVEWEGLKIDPRYRLKNQTIIEWLEITAEEEREMRTLISGDERRRRDKEEKRQERRDAGAMTREEYEGRAQVRRLEAHRMAAEGLRTQEIARTLGVSIHSVRSYLYRDV